MSTIEIEVTESESVDDGYPRLYEYGAGYLWFRERWCNGVFLAPSDGIMSCSKCRESEAIKLGKPRSNHQLKITIKG